MNIENKNNLTSIGKEIISTNSNKNKKILTLETPRENNIKKEIKEELNIKTIKPYNSINSFRNSNISTLNDTKKITTYFNLSKLNYKDGYILKDATNSNPGFGLWSIKLSHSNKNTKEKQEKKILGKRYYINNNLNIEIKEINDSEDNDINIFDSIENNYEEDQTDKIMINRLTKRNKKLEKKYNALLINYYEKENQYLTLERARKEYEKLIDNSIKEKNEAEYNLNNLDNANQALIVSISNARKEIERLINVIKETQINMKKELEEYNNTLTKEEEKRKKIIFSIKSEEKQINIFQDKIDENEGNVLNNNNNNSKKEKKILNKERENKINKKKEYIKQLQEELERLYKIDKEKQEEKNDLFKKINEINNDKKMNMKNRDEIMKKIENQQRDNKWNQQAIKIRNNIIYSLKRNSNSK